MITIDKKLISDLFVQAAANGRLRQNFDLRTSPEEGVYGCVVPSGAWHTVEVLEPSVILEMKDAIGQDEARKELKLCRCVVFHTSKVRNFDTQTYLQVYVYVTLCHGSLQVSRFSSRRTSLTTADITDSFP